MPTLFSTRYGFHRRFNPDITELSSNGAASPAAAAPKVDGTCWSGFQTETSQSATRAGREAMTSATLTAAVKAAAIPQGPVAAQPKSIVGLGYRGNPGRLIFDHDPKVRRRQRIGKHRRDSLDDLDCSTVSPLSNLGRLQLSQPELLKPTHNAGPRHRVALLGCTWPFSSVVSRCLGRGVLDALGDCGASLDLESPGTAAIPGRMPSQ